jgi:hypothetical protein
MEMIFFERIRPLFVALWCWQLFCAAPGCACGQESGFDESGAISRETMGTSRTVPRIVAVPFENGTSATGIDWQLDSRVVSAMNAAGIAEVIGDEGRLGCGGFTEAIKQGGYPLQVLVDALQQYRADAVLFARVTRYRAYPPLAIGITIHVVDTRDARVLATLQKSWNLGDPRLMAEYRLWLTRRIPLCAKPDIYLASPSMFEEFVADRIARTLR